MSDMTLIMCCSSTVLSLFFFSFVRWEEIVLVLLGHVLMTSMMTDETVLLFLYQQRGKAKEENFVQRLRKMQLEEERLRNPLAQDLPYTTDEPEVRQRYLR